MRDEVVKTDTSEEALLARWNARERDGRSIAEAVRETLVAAIVARELPPDWRLNEERLAVIFDVSRTPIREALSRLAAANLAQRDASGTLRVGSVTPEQMLDVYAVRRTLEGLAAALAAEISTPRLIAQLQELNRRCEACLETEDYDTLARRNLEFHEAIAAATGNEMLIRFMADISNWVNRIPTTTLTPSRAPTAIKEHVEIIAAIADRQPALAERLASEHIRRAERVRLQMLFGQPLDAADPEIDKVGS